MKCVSTLMIYAIVVKATVNKYGPTVVNDFSNCVSNLIESNFDKPGVLIFANSDYYSTSVSKIQAELLHRINGMGKYAVEVMNPEDEDVNICDHYDETLAVLHIESSDVRPMPAYFVIVVDSYKEFPLVAGRLLRSRSWNPSAKFIVLLFNFDEDAANIKFVERILTCLFKYNAINIVVIAPQANQIRNAIVYAWNTFDPPKYCGRNKETAVNRVYVHDTCEKGSLKENRSIVSPLPTDMKGCILDIIALQRQPFVSRDHEDANIEKILVDELARTYNFTIRYDMVNVVRGERELGVWDGALKMLTEKKGQLLLGGIFTDYDVHEDFECSLPYLADAYTWVVPRATHSAAWISLSIIFKAEAWYSVIAIFIITALFWRILGQLSQDTAYNKSLNHSFMNAWACTLGFSCYIRPTKQSLRVFFSFFNIYCILAITAYQTKLIDVLKNPQFDYQMQNVEELVESGLKFGGFEELHDLFMNSSDFFDNIIFEQWIDVINNTEALLDVAVHRNFSLLCSRLELAHIAAVTPELSDSYGNHRYFAYDTSMFSVPVEMVALRGFAFMKTFSTTLSTFKQLGLNDALRRRFANFNGKRRANLLREILMEKAEVNSLSLQHLQAGFLVLALGYLCGTIVLFLELIYSTEFVKRKLRYYRNRLRIKKINYY